MLIFIPLVLVIFCPMAYYLIQEIVWPDYPLALTIEPAFEVIRLIIAPSRRWKPAVTEQCVNVFNPEYIFANGLTPGAPIDKWRMLAMLHKRLLADYPNLRIYVCFAAYILTLVVCTVVGHLYYYKRPTEQNVDRSNDEMIQNLIYGPQTSLPVTVAHDSNVDIGSQRTAMRNLMQARIWRYVFFEQQTTTQILAKTLSGAVDRAFRVQDELDTTEAQSQLSEQTVDQRSSSPPTTCPKCEELKEKHRQKMSELKEQHDSEKNRLNQQMKDLEAKCESQKAEHENSARELDKNHKEKVAELEKKIEQQQIEIQSHESIMQDQDESLQAKNKEVQEKQSELDIATNNLRDKANEIQRLKDEEDRLKGKLTRKQKTISDQDTQITDLRKLSEEKQKEVDDAKQAQKKSDRDLNEALMEQARISQELEASSDIISDLRKQLQNLKDASAFVDQAIQQALKGIVDGKVDVEKRLAAAEAKVKAKQTTLEQTIASMTAMTAEKNTLENAIDVINKENADFAIRVASLKRRLGLASERQELAKDEKNTMQQNLHDLQVKNTDLEEKVKKLAAELDQCRASQTRLPAPLSATVEDYEEEVEAEPEQSRSQNSRVTETPAQTVTNDSTVNDRAAFNQVVSASIPPEAAHRIAEDSPSVAENVNNTEADDNITLAAPIAPIVSTVSPPATSNSADDSDGAAVAPVVIRVPEAGTDTSGVAEPAPASAPTAAPAAAPTTASRSLMASRFAVPQALSLPNTTERRAPFPSPRLGRMNSSNISPPAGSLREQLTALPQQPQASSSSNSTQPATTTSTSGSPDSSSQQRPSTQSQTTPAGTPPVSTPPANTPPANTPPANTPPANTPPANTPPANSSPVSGFTGVQASRWATAPAYTPSVRARPAFSPSSDAPPPGSLREQLFASLRNAPATLMNLRDLDHAGRGAGNRRDRDRGRSRGRGRGQNNDNSRR